ncbi:MAG: ABC transporter substrate-binding protein, partial [Cyanobacteria bacterium J06635_11]
TVPFSGSNANNAIEMLRGFAQAQNEVNKAGGINGVPLRLLVADDGDSEETARELAIALTSDPKYENVLGVVGHWTSDVSLKAAAIYRDRKQLVFMTPISTTKELSGYSPWVFRATINNRSGAAALAQHMLKTWGLKKAAVFYVDGVTYSEEIADEFAAILEGSSWGEVVNAADMGEPSFRPKHSVEQAKKAGAEVILLATNNGSLEDAIAVIKANKGQLKILGDLANLYTPKTLEDAGLVAEGMTMAVAWDIDGETNPAFVQQSKTLWKGPVNYVTAMSYGAVKSMAAAIAQSPTRDGVQSALSQETFQVLGAAKSPMEFVRGDLQTKVQLVEVTKIADGSAGATPLDFAPIEPQPTSVRSSQPTPFKSSQPTSVGNTVNDSPEWIETPE